MRKILVPDIKDRTADAVAIGGGAGRERQHLHELPEDVPHREIRVLIIRPGFLTNNLPRRRIAPSRTAHPRAAGKLYSEGVFLKLNKTSFSQ
jgi:hypothetical protein